MTPMQCNLIGRGNIRTLFLGSVIVPTTLMGRGNKYSPMQVLHGQTFRLWMGTTTSKELTE